MQILKATGELEEFKPIKLSKSLQKAGASKELTKDIVRHIEKEMRDGMSSSQIYKHAFFLLKKKQSPVAARYSLKNAVMELGPSGFPFEKFIAEILKAKGFEVKVGENIKGECAEHEVDVVSYNEKKLFMVEAKFHNRHGVKTDLKTALYVKARFDDIKNQDYEYGKKRKFNENWLVTNTKFTTSAVKYGKCNSMKLIGWNYPTQDNLQDIIDDSGLHPLTCLTTLSNKQKSDLLKKGLVLCKKLKDSYNDMKSVGIQGKKINEIGKEITQVCRL